MPVDEVRIPKERIAIFVGKNGADKKILEMKTHTKLKIDSYDGMITIEGEALDVFNAKPIIKAIGRGFNPIIAEELLNEDYAFELVDIKDFAKTKNDIMRIRARIIGRKGGCRKNIEDITNTKIVVYGRTVGIIGSLNNCMIAKQGVEKLLSGSKHGSVYSWIERKKKEYKTINQPI
ncbi:RNA-processing protein [Candidatus Woesearchaeota archaeon]|nr:RNA-processing protein [Candidatus Woesearchaeota archaeon]